MKRFLAVLFIMVMVPYVTTLAWTGRLDSEELLGFRTESPSGKTVVTEQNGKEFPVDAEAFLPGVLAAQIPAEYGIETLKAQAVLTRTYLYREMDGASSIREEALDIDCMSRAQMEKLWGGDLFAPNYQKFEQAVRETRGQTLRYQGTFVEPFFCRAAAGMTRSGKEEYPYLRSVESSGDLEADGFLNLTEWTPGQLASKINSIPDAAAVDAGQLPAEIQIVERDAAGYVLQVQVGAKTYRGEELQYALGLPSPNYEFEELGGKIRISCKGIGHGYGFSQAGANALEREQKGYEELLSYYFRDTELDGEKS